MSYADHDHRGEYASDNHDHYDYAEKHHRHYDDESTVSGLREDLGHAEERIRELEDGLGSLPRKVEELRAQVSGLIVRVQSLEGQTPQARQLQLEADQSAADLAEPGYDRHGRDCQCSYCATDDEPEVAGHLRDPEGDEAAHA